MFYVTEMFSRTRSKRGEIPSGYVKIAIDNCHSDFLPLKMVISYSLLYPRVPNLWQVSRENSWQTTGTHCQLSDHVWQRARQNWDWKHLNKVMQILGNPRKTTGKWKLNGMKLIYMGICWWFTRPGKRLHHELERSIIFHGKTTRYVYRHGFNSYNYIC